MKEFLMYVLSLIVEYPEEINIEENVGTDENVNYIIHVNSSDIGKVIGKEGKIIQALRNLLKVLAIRENKHFSLEVV